jgi:hypothetical protein
MYQGQSATYVVQYFGTPLEAAAETAVAVQPAPAATTSKPVATRVSTSTPVAVSTTTPLASASEGAQVEGASVQVAPVAVAANDFNSDMQSFVKQAMRAFAEPLAMSNWILGLCAAILVLAIALTFFTHLQIQPTHVLVNAAFVALFALSLLGINSLLTGGGGGNGSNASQAASPLEATAPSGVVINSDAAATGYALFPH